VLVDVAHPIVVVLNLLRFYIWLLIYSCFVISFAAYTVPSVQ
jgi:hypothetical protein